MERENVIKGLQNLRDAIATDYIHEADQAVGTIDDALLLLKEQEAVAPEISESYRTQSGRMSRRRAWCGACGLGIRIGSNKRDRSNFCERCGRPVKWD